MSVQLDIINTYEVEIDFISENEVVLNMRDGITVYQNGTKVGVFQAVDFRDGTNTTAQVDNYGNKARVYINSTASGGGSGDVTGPSSSTDGEVVLFNGVTGKIIKASGKVLTTVGGNLLALTNPGAIRFLKINADNTVTARTAAEMLSDLGASPKVIGIACSDETTALTAGTGKVTFRMPYAMTLTAVRATLTTAQTSGSIFTVDINEGGTTILSTKLTIDNTEKTSTTAATPPVISDTALADDAEITIDIDQIGDGTAKGLKIWLIG